MKTTCKFILHTRMMYDKTEIKSRLIIILKLIKISYFSYYCSRFSFNNVYIDFVQCVVMQKFLCGKISYIFLDEEEASSK